MMKKISFFAFAAIIFMTSCTANQTDASSVQYVYLMSSFETKLINGPLRKMEFTYGDDYALAPTEANIGGQFKTMPILRIQTIAGDTVAKIEYQYPNENELQITTTSASGTRSEHYSLDANKMATNTSGKPQIAYDSDGYRTKVGECILDSQNTLYTRVDSLGKTVVNYSYTNYYNPFGIQQHNIYGSQYNWPTSRFGKQSPYLLNRATRIEKGMEVVYDYKYLFDTNGFVQKEVITRNQEEFIVNTYAYTLGTISL